MTNLPGPAKVASKLDPKLSQWTRKYTAKQLFRLLQESGVAAGIPSSGEDLFHDIHLRARGHIVETEAEPWGKSRTMDCRESLLFQRPAPRVPRPGSAPIMIKYSVGFLV